MLVSIIIFSQPCPPMQLSEQPGWYFGNIKWTDAERILLQTGNPAGTFLIGDNDSQSEHYQYFLAVRDTDRVVRYRIRKVDTGEDYVLL